MRTFLRALAVSVALLSSLFAQQKQSKHIVPSTAHELILPYVTLEPGWRTSLEVRNNLADRKILIAPSFRLSNGREIELPAVEIKSDEIKSLNLATVVGGLNANLVGKTGTFGSVVLRFTSPSSGNIYAAAMVDRDGAPVAYHFDAVSVNTGYAAGAYEGLWWLPSDNVTALLILTNSSEDLVTPELTWFGANGRSKERLEPLGPHQTRRIDVRSAITRAKIKSSFGGLQLSVTDHVGAIQLQHIMFDEIAGFSAIMRTAPHELTGKVTSHTLRAPMVALTTPDPALAFPSGTTLDSRIFIRNTTDDALPVVAQINWRTDSATGSVPLEIGTLQAQETKLIDLSALQNTSAIPNAATWAGIHFSYQGRYGDLVATGAAFSENLRYGAQSPFRESVSFMWKGGMWKVDGTHNSLITAGNGGAQPATVRFLLFNADGSIKYEFPDRSLKPGEQMWVDVGRIIHDQLPDRNGKTLPSDTATGSYQIEDAAHPPIGHIFEGKLVLDTTYGHVGYGCALCDSWSFSWQVNDPLNLDPGDGNAQSLWAQDDFSGMQEDFTKYSYGWYSTNTSIATVGYNGAIDAVAPGEAYVYGFVDVQNGGGGYYDPCPTTTDSPAADVVIGDPCTNGHVSARTNDISSACVMSTEQANASVASLSTTFSDFIVTGVSVTKSNTITTVENAAFNDVGSYSSGLRSATYKFQTNLGGQINWTFTGSCSGTSRTWTITTNVTCPGP